MSVAGYLAPSNSTRPDLAAITGHRFLAIHGVRTVAQYQAIYASLFWRWVSCTIRMDMEISALIFTPNQIPNKASS